MCSHRLFAALVRVGDSDGGGGDGRGTGMGGGAGEGGGDVSSRSYTVWDRTRGECEWTEMRVSQQNYSPSCLTHQSDCLCYLTLSPPGGYGLC